MPELVPTDHYGEIVWLGTVADNTSIRSTAADKMTLTFDGPVGEGRHGGRTRSSCVRVKAQHPQGTEIANVRQLSILSAEELDDIAQGCGLDAVDPIWLGASIVVRGIPDFSHVPPSSRLQGPDGATITINMENRPCNFPAREMEQDRPGHGKAFKTAAKGRRGVTAWVERPGVLEIGQALRLHIPDQPAWRG